MTRLYLLGRGGCFEHGKGLSGAEFLDAAPFDLKLAEGAALKDDRAVDGAEEGSMESVAVGEDDDVWRIWLLLWGCVGGRAEGQDENGEKAEAGQKRAERRRQVDSPGSVKFLCDARFGFRLRAVLYDSMQFF